VSNNEDALCAFYGEIHDRRYLCGSIGMERITFEAQKHRKDIGQEVSAQEQRKTAGGNSQLVYQKFPKKVKLFSDVTRRKRSRLKY